MPKYRCLALEHGAGIPQIGDYIARVSAPVAVVAPNAVKVALAQNPNIKKVAVLFAQNEPSVSRKPQPSSRL